jgi:hypothetical protein
MSTEADKFNHSKRLQQNENAVKKQLKIAKQHNSFSDENNVIKQPHRLEKHHAMDCGQPGCMLCGNPRKLWHELTAQEKRMFQETEIRRMRHSNGTIPEDDNE